MRAFICKLSRRQLFIFFGIAYAIPFVMAMFPPLYLYTSGRSTLVLGMPLTIWYWLLNGLLVFLVVLGLNVVERIRGELDSELADTEEEGKAT